MPMHHVGRSARKQGNNKRAPRMNGPAGACIVKSLATGEVLGTFSPARPLKRRKVVTLPNGELILRISDL